MTISCGSGLIINKIIINGENITKDVKNKVIKGYLYIKRAWEPNTKIQLEFEMRTQILRSNLEVKDNLRKVALKRGPIIYCFESLVSSENINPDTIYVKTNEWITERLVNNDLGQYVEIETKAEQYNYLNDSQDLYFEQKLQTKQISITLIPYFMWCNRGESYLAVWLNEKF